MREPRTLALLCVAVLAASGCASRQIVRAAPPSVSSPPPEDTQPMPQPEPLPTPAATPTEAEAPPEVPNPEPPSVPAKRPVAPKPRSAPSETVEPAQPKPAPPQISPQLSPKDLEAAKKSTTANMTTAQSNLRLANGKQLNPAQKDLADKITSFLSQSRDAIQADDWSRAQNLAEKARVLSAELVKSF